MSFVITEPDGTQYEVQSIHPIEGVFGDELARAFIEWLHLLGARFPRVQYPIRGGSCPWCGRKARPGHLWCDECWQAKWNGWPMPTAADPESGIIEGESRERLNNGWAAAHGLSVFKPRNRNPRKEIRTYVMREGCQCCGGLYRLGDDDTLCIECRGFVRQLVRAGDEHGVAVSRVRAWRDECEQRDAEENE